MSGHIRCGEWSADEDRVLLEMLRDGLSDDEIAALLSRTRGAVMERRRSRSSGVQRRSPCVPWASTDTDLLRELVGSQSDGEIAFLMGRSTKSVEWQRLKLGLLRGSPQPPRNPVPWTREDDELLARLFPHERTADVAAQLNHTLFAVRSRAQKLGITKSPAYLVAAGREFNLLPKEVKEVIHLAKKLREAIHAQHQ